MEKYKQRQMKGDIPYMKLSNLVETQVFHRNGDVYPSRGKAPFTYFVYE